MRTVSERYLAALNVSHDTITTVTCTPPGGEPVRLRPKSCQIQLESGTGRRRSARVEVTPKPGADLYGIVSTPGAIFHIDHGVRFNANDVETLPVFHGEASVGGVSLAGGDISLTLTDLWQRVERSRFKKPYSPTAGTRAQRIADAVTEAVPGTTVHILAQGGNVPANAGTWDRDRTQFIRDLASDGEIECWFDADGSFVIRSQPEADPKASVFTFRTGAASNIIAAERERPLDRLYNTVIVTPADAEMTWPQQEAAITDPNHPRHPDKVGVVPYFYASPTITTAGAALSAARTILKRVEGTTERLSLVGLANPALEPGDSVTALHPATETDPGFTVTHLFDSGSFDTVANDMSINTTAFAELEEST